VGSQESFIERVRWRHNPTGQEAEKPIRNVFLFIGADPATEWLRDSGVRLDAKGFVLTGADADDHGHSRHGAVRQPMPLETNQPGVFAVGDVRSGSVKRVGAAIGEGAAVVPQLHAFLTDTVLLPGYAPQQGKQTVAA
jgi:thioredoxin reductase (NADPH)